MSQNSTPSDSASSAHARVNLDAVTGIENHGEIKTLRRQVDGVGEKTARHILRNVGSLDNLEQMSRQQFLSLDGIGPSTASEVGIWDADGNPTGTLSRNPCGVCGQPCVNETRINNSGSAELEVTDREHVCVRLHFGGRYSGGGAIVFEHEPGSKSD